MTLDLVSQPQIAERLKVTTNTVHVWRQRHPDFPEPEWQLGQVPIWRWEVIEGWAKETGRIEEKPASEVTYQELEDEKDRILNQVNSLVLRMDQIDRTIEETGRLS